MSAEETHKVNIRDNKLSKYELMLYLVSLGYVTTTALVILDAASFVFIPSRVPSMVDGALGAAWLGWTAGLFGWLYGSDGKN